MDNFNDRYIEFLRGFGIPLEIIKYDVVEHIPVYPEGITTIKVDDGIIRHIHLDNGETITTIIRGT